MVITDNKIPESAEGNSNYYQDLSDKAKEIAPQIERLLNGLNYKEIEDLFFTLLKTTKGKSIFL